MKNQLNDIKGYSASIIKSCQSREKSQKNLEKALQDVKEKLKNPEKLINSYKVF